MNNTKRDFRIKTIMNRLQQNKQTSSQGSLLFPVSQMKLMQTLVEQPQ